MKNNIINNTPYKPFNIIYKKKKIFNNNIYQNNVNLEKPNLASNVKDFYMKMWNGASKDIPVNNLNLVN